MPSQISTRKGIKAKWPFTCEVCDYVHEAGTEMVSVNGRWASLDCAEPIMDKRQGLAGNKKLREKRFRRPVSGSGLWERGRIVRA